MKSALAEAMALSGAVRAAYLERIGARDPALRADVESLLAADREAGTRFLECPAAALAEVPRQPNRHAGRRLGPYQLLEEIGAGGMGEVYRGVRADGEYEHQVAIKLVRFGMDAEFIGQRLRTERQILAAFQHPNIARLLDGGTTEDGVPYLVMELIEGEPADRYCERHRLDLDARLRLFLEVCSAVQYAHQRAVIHRDLKPRNILVTTEGVPKLLDFGIAKILEPGPIPARSDLTINAGRVILTPDYASPEQLTGEPISAASDVYSLGVILYELLTGVKPFPLSERVTGGGEVLKPVPAAAPPRPSAAVRRPPGTRAPLPGSPDGISRRLRGDLDNIVLMALRYEPERRYPTVDRLADDIRRHLRHQPVSARKPTLGYRVSGFVARHRLGVLATALIAVALLAGIVMTARETFIARAALDRAQDEASASQEVTDYLVSLFEGANPEKTGGQALKVQDLVSSAQAHIDPHLVSQPLLRAQMLTTVGTLYCEIGQSSPCRRDLEQALGIEKAAGSGTDPLLRAHTEYRLASAYNDAGRTGQALRLLRGALPILAAQQPPDTRALAGVWNEFGHAYLEAEPRLAIAALQRARALERGPHGEDTVDSVDTLGTLAIAEAQALRWRDALALAQERVQLVQRHFSSSDVRYFDALNDYAEVASEAGRYDEARQNWERVLTAFERIFGRNSDKYIDTELSIGDVLFRRNRLGDSILWFRQSVDDYRAQGNLHRERYIGALFALSNVLWMHGDYQAAASAAEEAFRTYQQTSGPTPQMTVVYSIRLAHPLAFVGETSRAIALLSSAVPGQAGSSEVISFEGLRALYLADAYREAGANDLAERSYDRAIAYYRSHPLPHSAALSMTYDGKAQLLAHEGRFSDSVPLFRLAIAGYLASRYAPDGPSVAAARIGLAQSLLALGRRSEARALLAEAGPIVDTALAPNHPARVISRHLREALRLPDRVLATPD